MNLQDQFTQLNKQLRTIATSTTPLPHPYHFESVPDASLQQGDEIDNNGDWEKAGSIYWSVYKHATDPRERAKGLISAVQMLINHNELDRATKMLADELPTLDSELQGRDAIYVQAYAATKPGWIADLEGRYKDAIAAFEKAKSVIAKPQDEDEEVVMSTSRHFIGRNAAQLAISGIATEENFALAKKNIQEEVEWQKKMIEKGKPNGLNLAFQYHWLTTIALFEGELDVAQDYIDKERPLIEAFVQNNQGSGAMGYLWHDEALFACVSGNMERARARFEEELNEWTTVQKYERGQADAYLGLAMVAQAEGNDQLMQDYLQKAVAANPKVVKRGFV